MTTLTLLASTLSVAGIVPLLVWLLILAIVIYVFFLVLGMLPIPAPIKTIATLIIALVFLVILFGHLGIAL